MLKTVTNVRYLNKNNNANERENYAKWWKEQIEHYGTSTTYFTHGYSLTSHNFLYGEDPTSRYGKIEDVIMMTDITNDSLMLSKFGIMADCDMTAVIHISSFYEKAGCGIEPKAGDLIQLTEYGADRPGGRSAPIYEITERDDEYLPMTNSLIGHYVWYIKCKRFEYSYEPGMETGSNNKQISDGGDYGRIAGGENPEELFQPYPDSVQNSAKCIYDYYSEDTSELNLNSNNYFAPAPPYCPEDLTVTGLSAVTGPYVRLTPEELLDTANMRAMLDLGQQAASIISNIMLAPDDETQEPPDLSSVYLDTFLTYSQANSADIIIYNNTEGDAPMNLNLYDGGSV